MASENKNKNNNNEEIQISSDDCGSHIFAWIKRGRIFSENSLTIHPLNSQIFTAWLLCHQKGWSWGCVEEWTTTKKSWFSLAHSRPCLTSPLSMTLCGHLNSNLAFAQTFLSEFLYLLTSQFFTEILGNAFKTKSLSFLYIPFVPCIEHACLLQHVWDKKLSNE